MTFLPEDDRAYLATKELTYQERTEDVPGGTRRNALLIPEFRFEGDLYANAEGQLIRRTSCKLLILIPQGYATTKLDSWYTHPRLVRANGTNPPQTDHTENMFGDAWQFWSRHLDQSEWRAGIDGLETYLQYVLHGLRSA